MISVRKRCVIKLGNDCREYLADIGDGTCVHSYSVTVGATALATTIDYSTPVSTNCSYIVQDQVSSTSAHHSSQI